MSSGNSVPRKKKTKEEIKKSRAKRENVRRSKEASEIVSMRQERQELQASLGGVIRSVADIGRTVGSEEYADKLGPERVAQCQQSISEFAAELESQKGVLKKTVTELENLENKVISKSADIADIVFPYNLTATPLMDTIVNLTHKGIETVSACNQILMEVAEENPIQDEKAKTDE